MTNTHLTPLTHDPIEASLSPADDRVLLNDWLPPKVGVVPKIRIGRYWINVLWRCHSDLCSPSSAWP